MEKLKKGTVTSKMVTKGLIIGFLSYGLMVGFIYCVFIAILYSYYQTNLVSNNNPILLSVCTSLLISIGIVFLNYGICKLSTMDILKKAKLSRTLIKKSSSSMGTFFICLMIFIVLFLNYSLLVRIINDKNALMLTRNELTTSEFSASTAQSIFDKEVSKYEISKKCSIIRTLILEFGFIFSYISLMPYHKKILDKYNGTFEASLSDADPDSI